MKSYFLLCFFFTNACLNLYAYDFQVDRTKLENGTRLTVDSLNTVRLAILYDNTDVNLIKTKTNLVLFKKEQVGELTKVFVIADPIVVDTVIKKNNLAPSAVISDQNLYSDFIDRTEATHVLLIKLSGDATGITSQYELTDFNKSRIISFSSFYPYENNLATPTGENKVDFYNQDYRSNSNRSGNTNWGVFPLAGYHLDATDNWSGFSQTGYIDESLQYLDIALKMEDLTTANLPVKYLRYGVHYQVIEIGLQVYGTSVHESIQSVFLTGKLNLINQRTFDSPFFLSLGLKANLHRKDTQIEHVYAKDKSVTDKNASLNDASLTMAVSYLSERLGSFFNFYIDNTNVTLGLKSALHAKIKAGFDIRYLTIKTDYDNVNGLLFFDFKVTDNFLFGLDYQSDLNRASFLGKSTF